MTGYPRYNLLALRPLLLRALLLAVVSCAPVLILAQPAAPPPAAPPQATPPQAAPDPQQTPPAQAQPQPAQQADPAQQPPQAEPQADPGQQQPPPGQPAAAPQATDPQPDDPQAAEPDAAQPQQQQEPAATAGGAGVAFRLRRGVSLFEVIDIFAQRLRINYVIDPAVPPDGSITISTYGTLEQEDLFPLFETILRMNGVAAVQVGNVYRIVPLDGVQSLPISPQAAEGQTIPEDERMVLNIVRLRYSTAADVEGVLAPFLGEGGRTVPINRANTLLILDNSRNMRRTMELIALFDTEALSEQRMRLFEIENGLASVLAAELEQIFAALSLSEDTTAIRFVPLQRINSLLAVSGSASVFGEVESWVKKLDKPVTVGGIKNFVYRVQYGLAANLASTLLRLYGAGGGFGDYGYGGGYGGGMGGGYGMGGGQFGQPGMGMGAGGIGAGGMGMGGMGGGFGGSGMIRLPNEVTVTQQAPAAGAGPPATDQTGQLLGEATAAAGTTAQGIRIVADPVNNLIVVQGTQQEWEVIQRTLQQLDFPPRQVLIQAKVYEVSLSGALTSGVEAYLARRGGANTLAERKPLGGFTQGGVINLTLGALVGNTRELALYLSARESSGRSRVISAPSLIATDNIAANITVGQSVPTLSSQALAGGAQSDGSSLFTNTISNVQTGVTLSVTARVNASGIITMEINQEVSSPQLPGAGDAIQSPTIDRRSVRTQITVNDGDTVAIAGIIQETDLFGRSRVPGLGSIPILGGLFGGTSSSKVRTELVVMLTPRVIYDETELVSASEELKTGLRSLRKIIR